MNHGITGFDHLVVAVEDLEQARAAWTRLGFTCTPRGRHRNLATGNYCIMFAEDYVELIGIVDPTLPDRGLMSRMAEAGEGLDRLAFAVRDVDFTASALENNGFAMRGPMDLHRPLELPEGEVEPRFRLMHFEEPDSTPGLHGFICYHETPEITRGDPAWLSHANGVVSVDSVTVVVDDPATLQAGWQALLGDEAALLDGDRLTVFSGSHRIEFIGPAGLAALFPAYAAHLNRPAPFMAAATFHVDDLAATADFLAAAEVAHTRHPSGDIEIAPAEANGALLSFIATSPLA